jgi:argonaute-like protein implicated in RNA metabolism and viral defense
MSCAGGRTSSSSASTSEGNWLVDLAAQEVGERATIEANRDASFSLCWNDKETEAKVPALQFIIVRMSDHKVVEQGSVTMGEVRWSNDYEVQVSHLQGQVQLERGPDSNTRTIDVRKYLDVVGR